MKAIDHRSGMEPVVEPLTDALLKAWPLGGGLNETLVSMASTAVSTFKHKGMSLILWRTLLNWLHRVCEDLSKVCPIGPPSVRIACNFDTFTSSEMYLLQSSMERSLFDDHVSGPLSLITLRMSLLKVVKMRSLCVQDLYEHITSGNVVTATQEKSSMHEAQALSEHRANVRGIGSVVVVVAFCAQVWRTYLEPVE